MVAVRGTHGRAVRDGAMLELTPKGRGQLEKKIKLPRLPDAPVVDDAQYRCIIKTVLRDYGRRKDLGEVPHPDSGFTDLAAQTLEILDMLGLHAPGFVTVRPSQKSVREVVHMTVEEYCAWQTQRNYATERNRRRAEIFKGDDTASLEETARLTRSHKKDDALLKTSPKMWLREFRGGLDTWREGEEVVLLEPGEEEEL